MSTQEMTSTNNLQNVAVRTLKDQYTLWQILAIWAGAALPMGLVYWVVMPTLSQRLTFEPGFVYFVLITLGLVWQGILAYIILKREVRPFTWKSLKNRLWLYTPSHPKTGIHSKWLYLWTVPLITFMNLASFGWLNELWVKSFPFLEPRPYGVIQNLADIGVGQWWLLGVLALMIVFNYLLGEELVFRGILLPKMGGVFGKWDWLANHLLFTAYHLHFFWTTPSRLFISWIFAWSTKRFKSYWMGVIVHGSDAVFLVIIIPIMIMGLI